MIATCQVTEIMHGAGDEIARLLNRPWQQWTVVAAFLLAGYGLFCMSRRPRAPRREGE